MPHLVEGQSLRDLGSGSWLSIVITTTLAQTLAHSTRAASYLFSIVVTPLSFRTLGRVYSGSSDDTQLKVV